MRAFCLATTDCLARGVGTCHTDLWVHHLADGDPTMSPTVAHDNGSNTTPVGRIPTRTKKQCKVRSRAHTFVPTTICTTRYERIKKAPPPTDGWYPFEGDSTREEQYTKNDPTPQCHLEGTGLQAWLDDCRICAYHEIV